MLYAQVRGATAARQLFETGNITFKDTTLVEDAQHLLDIQAGTIPRQSIHSRIRRPRSMLRALGGELRYGEWSV